MSEIDTVDSRLKNIFITKTENIYLQRDAGGFNLLMKYATYKKECNFKIYIVSRNTFLMISAYLEKLRACCLFFF